MSCLACRAGARQKNDASKWECFDEAADYSLIFYGRQVGAEGVQYHPVLGFPNDNRILRN